MNDDNSRRPRRFPFFSVIILCLLIFAVGWRCYLDVDTPRRAFNGIGQALSQFRSGLSGFTDSLAEGFIISDTVQSENTLSSEEDTVPLLVNLTHPLPDDYVPEDLVNMRSYCDGSVVYIKGSEIEGNRTAVDALMVMLRAGIEEGYSNWQISAGYRSIAYQQKLWDNSVYDYRKQGFSSANAVSATARYVAKPGCSEHHTGLAFDITIPGESFSLTKQCAWLTEHCWEYGFIVRYTAEKENITGFGAEAWHFRYVGQPHALIMRDKVLCLEEYIDSLGVLPQ